MPTPPPPFVPVTKRPDSWVCAENRSWRLIAPPHRGQIQTRQARTDTRPTRGRVRHAPALSHARTDRTATQVLPSRSRGSRPPAGTSCRSEPRSGARICRGPGVTLGCSCGRGRLFASPPGDDFRGEAGNLEAAGIEAEVGLDLVAE